MPLSLEQFKESRFCKQLVLPDEEQPQDVSDWKRMVQEDQQKQYDRYLSQFEPNPDYPAHNSLRNNETSLHNTSPVLRKPNEKWNEYMRKYRKQKKCRHCGKLNP